MSDRLRVNKLILNDANCFEYFEFEPPPDYCLICGTNGIGKTSILNAIGACFSSNWESLPVKRRAIARAPGSIIVNIQYNNEDKTEKRDLINSDPISTNHQYNKITDLSRYLLYVTPQRDFEYRSIKSVTRDEMVTSTVMQKAAERGISHIETKNWFVNRFIFQYLPQESRPAEYADNLELAIRCFSIMDPNISFQEVNTQTFDIIVRSPNGIIPYEYLSSGYRSALSLLLSLIREIEYRQLGVSAAEFSGIIMIDEIDLHLHPTWQQALPATMRKIFPNAQIIATTHSPHIIQEAPSGSVVALKTDEDGHTRHNDIKVGRFGFRGWTVEEILEDVMGMRETQSRTYRDVFLQFDEAIDAEDADKVNIYRKELEEMLHPSNELRKLIKLQAAPFEDAE